MEILNSLATPISCALVMLMYMVIGIGIARMIEKTHKKFSLFVVVFWPICCCVYACIGDIDI